MVRIVWAGGGCVRTYFAIGFPWNLLGYPAYRNLQLIQFAEFTGVYGVSALIIFFNAVVYVVVFRVASRRVQTTGLGVLTALMALALIFGAWRIDRIEAAPVQGSIRVALVQGNIPPSIK